MTLWLQRCRTELAAAIVASTLLATSCTSGPPTSNAPAANAALSPPAGLGLQTVMLPDVSKMEPSVRQQMEAQFSSLQSVVATRSPSHDALAAAYGETGKLLLAATLLDAAEGCFLNAQTLAPGDRRWPYYLGQIYKGKGPIEKSVASFERARQLAPDDVATLIWLGDAYLSAGNVDGADRVFGAVIARQPSLAAARYGEGRAALAKRDYQRAVDQLTDALAREPQATSIHYPLAMAYRGLGDVKSSEAHLAQQGQVDPRPPDPLMGEIDGLLQSPEAYNLRGGAELEAGHWEAAAEQFRRGLELAPNEPSMRQRFGTALYQMGDKQGAAQQFEQVLRTTPDYARAHFSLGVLLNDAGQYSDAIAHFRAAVKSDPKYVEAHVQLAGVLARNGQPGEAVVQYTEALDASPTNADALFGRAMAFIRLRRYADARDALTAGMKSHADQPMFVHALARLLAAAPDDGLRDGPGALKLIDQLVKGPQTIELAETTAMALAEVGRFKEAVEVQRDALTAATTSNLAAAQRRIINNLRLYESRRPCRTPFGEEELP
jgi:tetratricopeptide (TPR) repeat protein